MLNMNKMKIIKLLVMALIATGITQSCIKDELPNAECDIRRATIHLPRPQDYFTNLADTTADILPSFSSNTIQFVGVKPKARLNGITPTFTISEGAMLFPPQGTPRDFSGGKQQTYYVIAEDTKARYPMPDLTNESAVAAYETVLAAADKRGEHIRTYYVQFSSSSIEMADTVYYNFDNYYIEPKGKFYEWSDLFDGHERAVPNWATANMGFSTARGSAKPSEYPTVPVSNGGIDGGPHVMLQTCDTGKFGEMFNMPLAAGNLFLGTFDFSVALTNTLHATRFGENSILGRKPVKLTGYYKYSPGAEFTAPDGSVIPGKVDQPAIYCVVYRNKDNAGNPVVLYGDDVETSSNRIGLAEVKSWKYSTSEWVEFDVSFDWFSPLDPNVLNAHGYSFAIVCSASKDGASYSGAKGSRLWVDNFRLIFE